MTQITAADGHCFSTYRADPSGSPLGAVVVAPDRSGADAHRRAVADRFAAEGYVAIALPLSDRVKPSLEPSADPDSLADEADRAEQRDIENGLLDLQAAAEVVKEAGKVAIVGYSWGAYLAFLAANEIPGLACVVGYYGGDIVEVPRMKRRIPTLLHFAEDDPSTPAETIKQFRANRPDVSVYTYAAGHGFDDDADAEFDAESARTSGERTLCWIAQFVVGQAPALLKNAGAYAAAKVEKKKTKAPAGDDLGPPMD
jgi:carboxymethylenebutenolidase